MFVVVLLLSMSQTGFVASSTAAARESDSKKAITVTTILSAAGVTPAAKITVGTGTSVTDQAKLVGAKAHARGEISYQVFSDSSCTSLVFDATPAANKLNKGAVPASKPFASSAPGVFFWQATYTRGDRDNEQSTASADRPADSSDGTNDEENDDDDSALSATSRCGDEQLTVVDAGRHLLTVIPSGNGTGTVTSAPTGIVCG